MDKFVRNLLVATAVVVAVLAGEKLERYFNPPPPPAPQFPFIQSGLPGLAPLQLSRQELVDRFKVWGSACLYSGGTARSFHQPYTGEMKRQAVERKMLGMIGQIPAGAVIPVLGRVGGYILTVGGRTTWAPDTWRPMMWWQVQYVEEAGLHRQPLGEVVYYSYPCAPDSTASPAPVPKGHLEGESPPAVAP